MLLKSITLLRARSVIEATLFIQGGVSTPIKVRSMLLHLSSAVARFWEAKNNKLGLMGVDMLFLDLKDFFKNPCSQFLNSCS
ncbi:unnamed protein product [Brassica rapa]|uniref:Uncharacterized protein n=2 Tax=Brassica TaxID=3705 RepID=A0A8D9M1E3_BRACM|nr:unnamed protein product [Brassica napus]CAG7894731.1 unnamed protein product [Brassica rapa]